jgi:hypothetical protein
VSIASPSERAKPKFSAGRFYNRNVDASSFC